MLNTRSAKASGKPKADTNQNQLERPDRSKPGPKPKARDQVKTNVTIGLSSVPHQILMSWKTKTGAATGAIVEALILDAHARALKSEAAQRTRIPLTTGKPSSRRLNSGPLPTGLRTVPAKKTSKRTS
jgi:hypothetical protein